MTFEEEIAELEHKQWMIWSQSINLTEKLSSKRVNYWKRLWKPYSELSDEEKQQDAVWAAKVIFIVDKYYIKKKKVEEAIDGEISLYTRVNNDTKVVGVLNYLKKLLLSDKQ